jgi:SAM-dependent methyltransferase
MKITNPAFDYDRFGHKYSGHRKTDPRIAQYVHSALNGAKTVLNIGAGAGSYEPSDAFVMAVEPSSVMRAQRLAKGISPAINAKADSLPFDDKSFDASMAMVTVHHWPDIAKGLTEMRRVTKGECVILTFDPEALDLFWNAHYFPELIAVEKARYPKISHLKACLGPNTEVLEIPIPLDCLDGFQEAYYGRPEAFLENSVRDAQSAWGFLDAATQNTLVKRLADDLETGAWDAKFGHFRSMQSFTCALRLLVAR